MRHRYIDPARRARTSAPPRAWRHWLPPHARPCTSVPVDRPMPDSCWSEQIAFSTKLDAFAQSKLAAWAEDIRRRDKSAAQPIARMTPLLPAFALGNAMIAEFQESGALPAGRRPNSRKSRQIFMCFGV